MHIGNFTKAVGSRWLRKHFKKNLFLLPTFSIFLNKALFSFAIYNCATKFRTYIAFLPFLYIPAVSFVNRINKQTINISAQSSLLAYRATSAALFFIPDKNWASCKGSWVKEHFPNGFSLKHVDFLFYLNSQLRNH